MNSTFKLQAKQLVRDAYAQHECSHGNFKRKYHAEYEDLTNAIQAAAHEQLSAQEFQEINQPERIQALIKRMYESTRNWEREQWRREQQYNNQQQPGTTNSNSCKRERTHALSGHTNTQPASTPSTPVQSCPPAKKHKSRASTRNQFNRQQSDLRIVPDDRVTVNSIQRSWWQRSAASPHSKRNSERVHKKPKHSKTC
jgi:hypothetical protein